MLSAHAIALKAEAKSDNLLGQIRIINRLFRAQDESHKWPIRGRFDATERAIRQARAFARDYGSWSSALEYSLFINDALSRIVNKGF